MISIKRGNVYLSGRNGIVNYISINKIYYKSKGYFIVLNGAINFSNDGAIYLSGQGRKSYFISMRPFEQQALLVQAPVDVVKMPLQKCE